MIIPRVACQKIKCIHVPIKFKSSGGFKYFVMRSPEVQFCESIPPAERTGENRFIDAEVALMLITSAALAVACCWAGAATTRLRRTYVRSSLRSVACMTAWTWQQPWLAAVLVFVCRFFLVVTLMKKVRWSILAGMLLSWKSSKHNMCFLLFVYGLLSKHQT